LLILEARDMKRLSKKIKTEYMPLIPGEAWMTHDNESGARITIIADENNTGTIYVGKKGKKYIGKRGKDGIRNS